jgi:hypothetical protein
VGRQHPGYEGALLPFPDARRLDRRFSKSGQTHDGGTAAQTYAITGPGWTGALPPGVKEYKSPTAIVWLVGRIYGTGMPDDYKVVHALRDEFKLVPLSSCGKDYTPPPGKVDPSIDMKKAVRDQVNAMDAKSYFALLADLLKRNPASRRRRAVDRTICKGRAVPGQDFDAGKLDPLFLDRIPKLGFDRILLHLKFSDGDVKNVSGWSFSTKTGLYGTNYLQRALVECGRVYRPSYPKGLAGRGQGVQLAASARRQIRSHAATLLAERKRPINPGRFVGHTAGEDGRLNVVSVRLYRPSATDPSLLDGSWKVPVVKKISA